jgi:hypothetical protein
MKCIYCNNLIIQNSDGWGYDQEGLDRNYWHVECIEMAEGVAI